MSEATVPLVQSFRGEVIETVHRGAAAIVDVAGNLVASLGDPDAVYFIRSSGKPLQAVAAAETGAFEKFQYTDAQIALACASHSGEVAHITELQSTMAKIGVGEESLICGLSYPLYERRRDEMVRAGESPTRRHHNCSGKHAAMIAAALATGEDPATYGRPDHPHQQRIRRLISEMSDFPADRIKVGVDGCGVPVHALPLRHVALAFARLVEPAGLSPKRQKACLQITSAMTGYPYLVAGSARFDTVLLAAGAGRIVCKGGALGYFAAGVHLDHSEISPIGIALKIEDGTHQAACQAALEILDQLGILDEQHRWRLSSWHEPPVKNSLNQVVGYSRSVFKLKFEDRVA